MEESAKKVDKLKVDRMNHATKVLVCTHSYGTYIKVNKRIIFFGAIILLIELSGHGIFASLYRLLMSAN